MPSKRYCLEGFLSKMRETGILINQGKTVAKTYEYQDQRCCLLPLADDRMKCFLETSVKIELTQ